MLRLRTIVSPSPRMSDVEIQAEKGRDSFRTTGLFQAQEDNTALPAPTKEGALQEDPVSMGLLGP